MSSNIKLTEGGVSKLMRGEEVDKPVFQILGFKKIAGQGGSDRFRLNISDGNHSHTFAMLATQLNHMIPDGQLDNYCIIRAEKVVSNAVSEKRVLIILDLTVLATGSEVKGKIGNPVQFAEGSANPTSTKPLRVVQESAGNIGRPSGPPPIKYTAAQPSYGSDMTPAMPIRDINPYNSSKVTIKARVTNKTPIKTWSNSKGEGKLFSMDLLDDSGEIRMTGFNQQVDQFFDVIKVGNVYMFRNFFVKAANKNFSNLNNDYEISCNNDTQVVPCADSDAGEIPVVSYDFVEIANIEGVEKDRIIDVIGVCKRRGELQTFTSRNTNKEFTKRDLVLVDRTNREINITLWGKQAEDFEDDTNPVIAVKGAKVSDFNGKSLSCLNSSSILVNPDISEAHILRGWYDNEGMNVESFSLSAARTQGGASQWKVLREANTLDNAAANDKGDYYMSKVTVMAVKRENAMYKACPEQNCNKKVIDSGNGLFRCEKCNKETGDFKWRAMVNVNFADASDFIWATCFQETAEIILAHPAEVLGPLCADNTSDQFDGIIKDAVFKSYIAKFRAKMETYNNETRMKHSVVELHPVNFAEYAKKLMNEIKECGPA